MGNDLDIKDIKYEKVDGRWPVEVVEQALAIMAVNNGSRKRASEITGIPSDTLNEWAYKQHAEKYRELRAKARTQVAEVTMETMFRRAEEYGEAADIVKARLLKPENLDNLDPRELSNTFRNLATGAGIYLTNAAKHMQAMSDTPSVNININLTDQIRGLVGKGVPLFDDKGNKLSAEEAIAKATPEKVLEGTAKELKEGEQ